MFENIVADQSNGKRAKLLKKLLFFLISIKDSHKEFKLFNTIRVQRRNKYFKIQNVSHKSLLSADVSQNNSTF